METGRISSEDFVGALSVLDYQGKDALETRKRLPKKPAKQELQFPSSECRTYVSKPRSKTCDVMGAPIGVHRLGEMKLTSCDVSKS